jgi:hypothetical protein
MKNFIKYISKIIPRPIVRLVRSILNTPYRLIPINDYAKYLICYKKVLIRRKYFDLTSRSHFRNSQFVVIKNMVSYQHLNFNRWRVEVSPNSKLYDDLVALNSADAQIYIVIDTKFHDAFGHWFFECAIWIEKIKFILDKYPDAKILLASKKGFKIQILDFYGISPSQTATEIEVKNYTVFLRPCTALNDLVDHEYFSNLLNDFSIKFNELAKATNFSNDILLMPRQKVENFVFNDRQIDTSDLEILIAELENSLIFNTDYSPNFLHQIKEIQSSKIILLVDGSAFLVNGFLARNSVIIVLGDNLVPEQRKIYSKKQLICNHIERNNAVMYINSPNNVFSRSCIENWMRFIGIKNL